MSETRYSPEVLERMSAICRTSVFNFDTGATMEAMLRQAASDARVIAQLREWLREGNTMESLVPWHVAKRVLAHLDRLTHPAEEAE